MNHLGVDYGGTFTKLLLVDVERHDRVAVRTETVQTPSGGRALEELAVLVDRFVGADGIGSLGVTIAGLLNADGRTVDVCSNMPWLLGTDPAAVLSEALGAPGLALNDGEAAATAEAVLGAGRQWDDVFMVALGTGIAGAHVVDGKVRRGAHGAAGEVGHVATGDGRLCSCGQRGCLEVSIGGRALATRWAQERQIPTIATAKDVIAAAAAGDIVARRLLDEATTALARGLLGIVTLIDPAAIIVGGGLSNAREWILDPAIAKSRRWATFHQLPPIVAADLGVLAGAWGAALASERVCAQAGSRIPVPDPVEQA
ncbi:ROK family protein [Pseudactinotalea sp. HY158]|uniref:ROK family protein n=1 Tax=Pseudactinotalea sp. HY158 TaxID=2654547 RepID=UPI00129C8D97|nr:ROK family protein [Pseudactinotalea sp. HY158]QGH68301.1 ROK family protein [Pseudactinotalea sp. HY158]